MKKKFKFKNNGYNDVLDCWEFYISFNSNPWFGIFGSDDGSSETAFVVSKAPNNSWRFYILNGDLRKEIVGCKSKKEIAKVFIESKLSVSSWSNLNKKYVLDFTK